MERYYISLGRNGYSFDQVQGYSLRELLNDIGFYYEEDGNEDLLDTEIFAKDEGNRYGAQYHSISGLYPVEEDEEEDE